MSRPLALRATLLAVWVVGIGVTSLPTTAGNLLTDGTDVILTPVPHRRGEDQTYLTYPEWFLVFSPAEQARYLADRPPSGFPYFGHIRQFWESYRAVTRAMEDTYPFNFGYHVMVFVIGTSTTTEYALKAGYEAVFGRTFEGPATPEDQLAADVAQDYVDFIRTTPWYEYDFFAALRALWTQTPLTGPHLLRKWERRYMLSTEFLAKGLYAMLIKAGTRAGYDRPVPLTAVVLDRPPADPSTLPDLAVLATLDHGRVLVTVPRYDAFKDYASALAAEGLSFEEIAGNRGVILVSVLHRSPLVLDPPSEVLLTQTILTQPDVHRDVIRTTVSNLAGLLRQTNEAGAELEHVYDY